MGFFSSKKENKPTGDLSRFARVLNYIKIDSIDDKNMTDFYWQYGEKKKGLLAKKTEIIYLEAGEHTIIAHGVTYQTKPTPITVSVEANQQYVLGADEDGLFFEEY